MRETIEVVTRPIGSHRSESRGGAGEGCQGVKGRMEMLDPDWSSRVSSDL